MDTEEIIEKIAAHTGQNLEQLLEKFVRERLFKSATLGMALEITEEQMEASYREAYEFYQMDRFAEAADCFRVLAILDPYISRYWMGLGASLQLLEKWEEAVKCYAMLSLLSPDDPKPHLYAHECFTAIGDSEEAAKAWKSYSEMTDATM